MEYTEITAFLHDPIVTLFLIMGIGLAIGRIRIYGIQLGSSGVMFAALLFGAIGFTLPNTIGTLGLVLFVYCIGISSGPGFFNAIVRQGTKMAKLAFAQRRASRTP
jgi:putative transport protein